MHLLPPHCRKTRTNSPSLEDAHQLLTQEDTRQLPKSGRCAATLRSGRRAATLRSGRRAATPSPRWGGLGRGDTWRSEAKKQITCCMIMVFFIAPPPQPSPIKKGEGAIGSTARNSSFPGGGTETSLGRALKRLRPLTLRSSLRGRRVLGTCCFQDPRCRAARNNLFSSPRRMVSRAMRDRGSRLCRDLGGRDRDCAIDTGRVVLAQRSSHRVVTARCIASAS